MQDSVSEQISALADDELEKREIGRALDRLRDRDALDAWERYHIISDTLRGDRRTPYPSGLAQAVGSQIEAEPAYHVRAKPGFRFPRDYWRQAAGMAVAASVTAAAILGVQTLDRTPLDVARKGQLAEAAPLAENPAPQDSRFNDYLVEHSEYSASPGVRGMLPYVRLVSHR